MNIDQLVKMALAQERTTLTEAESKAILKEYGIPVAQEFQATTAEEAAAHADRIGYPVVLKGLGFRLTHKTERGLVKLNLRSAPEVAEAAREIAAGAGADLEGYLVQPQIEGRREFVAGLFRDDQFGPVLMFGLGGIFTEALEDVVFRIAPVDREESRRMIREVRAQKLLSAFRGEAAADCEGLVDVLAGLSRLACEHPEIREIDINPLIVSPGGRVQAVDALVVLGKALGNQSRSEEARPVPALDVLKALNPESVALIGVSEDIRKWGFRILSCILAGCYPGRLYLINPKGGEIADRKVYRSLAELPETVDLAIVTVPADRVLALMPAIQEKGIKKMLVITSGFGETGPEGQQLEAELAAAARKAGVLILGPNTMGVVNPHAKFYSIGSHSYPEPGTIAFISQSGNMGGQLLNVAQGQGLGIRCFIGSGNETMVTIEDYLECFAGDELTRIILLYIESIKDGRRFFDLLSRVTSRKPVVILKGGRTAEGNKAAASHTGGMASNIRVFQAACRQAGAIVVEHPVELVNTTVCLSALPVPRGNRIGLMTMGGGWGVVATDLCIENGLRIPPLSAEVIAGIDPVLPPFWSRSNPVDMVGDTDPTVPLRVLEELMRWDGCDSVIHLGVIGRTFLLQKLHQSAVKSEPHKDWTAYENYVQDMKRNETKFLEGVVRLMERYGKPVLGAYLRLDEGEGAIRDTVPGSPFKAAVLQTPDQVIKILSKLCGYGEWLGSRTGKTVTS